MSSGRILAVLIAALVAVNAKPNLGVCSKSTAVQVGRNDVSSFTNLADTDTLSGNSIYHPAWLAFYAPHDGAYDFEVTNWSINNATRMALYSARFPRNCKTPKLEAYNDDIGSKWHGPFARDNLDVIEVEDDEAAPADYAAEGQEENEAVAAISIGDDLEVNNEFGFGSYNRRSRFVVPLVKGHYKIALGNENDGVLGGNGELKISVKLGWCNSQINVAKKGNNAVDTKISQGYSENGIHKSVWFKFTAPQDDVYNIETTSWSSRGDSQLAIYDDLCNKNQYSANNAPIDSNDDYRGSDLSFIRHFMYEGDTILIQVGNAHSWQRHATGNLKISRSPGWCESTTNQWTTVSTGSNSVSAHWSEADDITYDGIKIDEPVWLTFTVEDAGAYKFEVNDWDVDDDDDNDSAMAIFSSPSGEWPDACPLAKDKDLHLIKIHDDIRVSIVPGLRNYRSRIVLELEEGVYKIALGNGIKSGSGSWRKGSGTLDIKLLEGWCNDQIHHLNAEGVYPVDAADSWHTLRAQSDIHDGVWFEFEAPKTATFIFETLTWSQADPEIALFDGECPNPNQLAINDDIRSRGIAADEAAESEELNQFFGAVADQKGERGFLDDLINGLGIANKLSRTEYSMDQGDKIKIYVGNADDDDGFATGSLEIHEAIGRCDTALEGSIDTDIAIDATRADSPVVYAGNDKIYNGVWIKFTAYDTAYYEFDVKKWNQPIVLGTKYSLSRAALFKTSCTGELIKKDTALSKSNIKATIEAGETVYFVVGNPANAMKQENDGVVRITRHWGECDDNSIRPTETWDNPINGTIASAADITSGSTKVYEPIWFKFKVPETGTWVFEVTDWESENDKRQIVVGNSKNAAIAVRGSSCFSGSWKAFNDNQNTFNVRPRVALKATKDEILRIAVGNGVNGRLAGSGNLRIYLAGGTCEDPYTAKEGFPYNDIYSTNTSGIVVNGVNNPVWYLFKAPRSGTYTLEVTSWDNGFTDNSQIVAYKYSASCSSLQKLAENNDIFFPFNLRSKAEVTLHKNDKIFIVVGNDLSFTYRGNGTLAITHRPGRCNTRYYIEAGKFYDVNATITEAPEKKIGFVDYIWKPVYYRFRAEESAVHVIDVASWDNDGDNDAEVAIWSMDDDDGCDLPTNRIVASDDDYADTKLPLVSAYLQKNKRYTIALGNAKPLQKAGVGKFALSAHGHCRNADRLRFWRTNTVVAWDAAAEDYNLGNDYDNVTIYTPVWTKFKSGRTGRYHFAVTAWDDGPNDGDDSIMAAVEGYCRNPTILTANDDSDHFTPDSKKSRVELSMDANDEIKIVVGSRNPTTRGWGKIKITFRDEPAKFAMVVPEGLSNAEIEAAINRALEKTETDDTINFISEPVEPTKKRSVLDKYYFDGAEPGFKIVYFEAAEGSDDKMATLTMILVNRNGTYSLIKNNFSPMLCVADCDGHDFDGDEVDDGVDVCPGVPDPLQRNSDGKGLGDLCQCAFVNAIIDPESLKDQGREYYGHIQTCDLLNEDNTKYHYHGQDKKAGDWVRNYVRNIGAVTFQPGDYTHTDKWLDCWCNTWEIDAGTPRPPFGPGFGAEPEVVAAEPFEWDAEIVDPDFQRPLEPPAVSAEPVESEN